MLLVSRPPSSTFFIYDLSCVTLLNFSIQIFYICYGLRLRQIASPKILPADDPIILVIFEFGLHVNFALYAPMY